ncbi:MAG TPA: phosphatase PAP2 family protein, partial [Paracoccaceae bacterium]|nr:phosphatase PAP2 family protein [Paracoccaceae bacterium]
PNAGALLAHVAGGAAVARLTRPVFDQAFVDAQLSLMRAYADLRADRMAEIMVQGTDILSFFGAQVYLDGNATRRTLDLVRAVLRLTGRIEMRLKMHFDLPRPITTSVDLQPVIQTPGHAAWPSGHATESFAVAHVLGALRAGGAVDARAEVAARAMPLRLAARIAVNRTVAGVHYPSDSLAGAVLGLSIGETVVNWLAGAEAVPLRGFDGSGFLQDFDLARLEATLAPQGMAAITRPAPGWLQNLWQVALSEWPR